MWGHGVGLTSWQWWQFIVLRLGSCRRSSEWRQCVDKWGMFSALNVSLLSANQRRDSGDIDQSGHRYSYSGFNKGKCHTYSEDQDNFTAHFTRFWPTNETVNQHGKIFVWPRSNIFSIGEKYFQWYWNCFNIHRQKTYQLWLCIYLCSVDDPAVECFVTGSGRGLPALDYNLIKADCWREECYLWITTLTLAMTHLLRWHAAIRPGTVTTTLTQDSASAIKRWEHHLYLSTSLF